MHFSWKSMVSHDGRLTTRKKIMGNADGEIRGGGGSQEMVKSKDIFQTELFDIGSRASSNDYERTSLTSKHEKR